MVFCSKKFPCLPLSLIYYHPNHLKPDKPHYRYCVPGASPQKLRCLHGNCLTAYPTIMNSVTQVRAAPPPARAKGLNLTYAFTTETVHQCVYATTLPITKMRLRPKMALKAHQEILAVVSTDQEGVVVVSMDYADGGHCYSCRWWSLLLLMLVIADHAGSGHC